VALGRCYGHRGSRSGRRCRCVLGGRPRKTDGCRDHHRAKRTEPEHAHGGTGGAHSTCPSAGETRHWSASYKDPACTAGQSWPRTPAIDIQDDLWRPRQAISATSGKALWRHLDMLRDGPARPQGRARGPVTSADSEPARVRCCSSHAKRQGV
jgi:hypothetical protein